MLILLLPIFIIAFHIGMVVAPDFTSEMISQSWKSIEIQLSSPDSDQEISNYKLTCKGEDTINKVQKLKASDAKLTKVTTGPYKAILKFHNSKIKKPNPDEVQIPKSADCLLHKSPSEKQLAKDNS